MGRRLADAPALTAPQACRSRPPKTRAPMKRSSADGVSFEQALKKLEEAVHKLEDGSLNLDDALKAFEQGIQWSRQCHQRLVEAEKKVEVLLKNEKDELTQVAFDLDESE